MAALNNPSQVHLISNSTLNTSGGSVAAAAAAASPIVAAGEPPTALRQNGDGTEAPSAPPQVQPIFESHSESVPVDGRPGTDLLQTVVGRNYEKFSFWNVEEGGVEGGTVQRPYSMADFELIRVIGRGSYAKVLMVELRRTRRVYAMKVIKKELVTDDEVIKNSPNWKKKQK